MRKGYMSGSTGGRFFNQKRKRSLIPGIRAQMLKAHAKSAHKGKVLSTCNACSELSAKIILT